MTIIAFDTLFLDASWSSDDTFCAIFSCLPPPGKFAPTHSFVAGNFFVLRKVEETVHFRVWALHLFYIKRGVPRADDFILHKEMSTQSRWFKSRTKLTIKENYITMLLLSMLLKNLKSLYNSIIDNLTPYVELFPELFMGNSEWN